MHFNGPIRNIETARKFFDLFKTVYPELEFQFMGQWEPLRKRFAPNDALVEWELNRSASKNPFGDYIFYGKDPAPFYAFVNWHGQRIGSRWADRIAVMFNGSLWRGLREANARAIRMFKGLASIDDPLYGRGYHQSEFEAKDFKDRPLPNGQVGRESISLTPREGLVDLYWLNYFGRSYVELFGRENLSGLKCKQKERLGGGFLMAFSDNPFQWNDQHTLELETAAKLRLNREAFFDHLRDQRPNLSIGSQGSLVSGAK